MTINDKIKYEKLQYDIDRDWAKVLTLSSGKIDKNECVTGKKVLSTYQSILLEQVKTIENQV